MRTFKYTGPKSFLDIHGESLMFEKPFETDNEILIAAIEARIDNEGDVVEVKKK